MSTPASFKPQPGAGTAADPLPAPEPSMSDSATGQELVEAEAGPGQAATTFITTCLRIGTQLGALPVVSRSEGARNRFGITDWSSDRDNIWT